MIYRWLILDLLRGQSIFFQRIMPEDSPFLKIDRWEHAEKVKSLWLTLSGSTGQMGLSGTIGYPKTRVWNLIFCLLKSHFFFCETSNLVGGWPTPLKNMKVSWEGLSHILWKIKNVWNHQQAILWHKHTSSLDEEITWVAWNSIK